MTTSMLLVRAWARAGAGTGARARAVAVTIAITVAATAAVFVLLAPLLFRRLLHFGCLLFRFAFALLFAGLFRAAARHFAKLVQFIGYRWQHPLGFTTQLLLNFTFIALLCPLFCLLIKCYHLFKLIPFVILPAGGALHALPSVLGVPYPSLGRFQIVWSSLFLIVFIILFAKINAD